MAHRVSSTDGRADRHLPEGGYRWTCYICGRTQVNKAVGDDGAEHALSALRAHVCASVGDGHGPRNEYPESFDPSTLSRYVVRETVDG